MICQKCKNNNPAGALFCNRCGEKLTPPLRVTTPGGDEAPRRFRGFGAEKSILDSDGRKRSGIQRPPAYAPKAKKYKRKDTFIPEKRERDLFFDPLPPDAADDFDEEYEMDFVGVIKRKIFSFVASALLIGIFCFIFWILVFPSGGVFCAKWGLPASAASFERLGDEYLASNQVKNAANAYYTALQKDPEGASYSLVLHVAQTQQTIGDTERAEKAYIMCISLDPTQKEPYEALAAIYRSRGDADTAEKLIAQMEEMAGQ